jgi:hypothetical protein
VKWLLVLLLAGCSAQKQEAYTVELINGCHIKVRVVDSESAGSVSESLDFKDCEVSHAEDVEK